MPKLRKLACDGADILVFDELIGADLQDKLDDTFVSELRYQHGERDIKGTRQMGFVANFDVADAVEDKFVKTTLRLVDEYFPGERFELRRAYCNSNMYGEMSYPHRDFPAADTRSLTVLWYVHKEWDRRWGGETLFYEGGEPVLCVAPRPWRAVLFRGSIEHKTGVPTRECYLERITFVLKLEAISS